MRVTLDYLTEQAGRDYLSELTVNIVPYKIADASLTIFVSEADDATVAEVEAALKKRQQT